MRAKTTLEEEKRKRFAAVHTFALHVAERALRNCVALQGLSSNVRTVLEQLG